MVQTCILHRLIICKPANVFTGLTYGLTDCLVITSPVQRESKLNILYWFGTIALGKLDIRKHCLEP